MDAYKKYCRLLLAACTVVFLAACHNYYKATQKPTGNGSQKSSTIDSLKLQNRYFILRNGSQSYYMSNIVLSEDKKTLTSSLEMLPANHQFHLVKGRKGKMQYQKNNPENLTVLNEVHFYIESDNTAAVGPYTLQLDKVEKIEVIEKDKKRTTSSYVIGTLGYTVGALVVVAIIIAATKSSCPFVSAYDGTNFSLQGEIYGGAIYPQLARHDYMPLKMAPLNDGTLQLKISNELYEKQFTDIADLWVVTHLKNYKVLVDEGGNLLTVAAAEPPIFASLNNQTTTTSALQKAGDNSLLYMDDTSSINASNQVVMNFNNPGHAKKAKLVLSLKNSYFLDLLYGELAKGFGRHYARYSKKQQKKPAANLLQWVKEQNIPLQVDVKTKNGWKKITAITTIGPLATRNIVVPMELEDTGEPITTIKLSSGFMFWEIDYAAMDYTEEAAFTVEKIIPATAIDELGKNVLPALQKEDAVYLEQPLIGNVATITYNAKALNDDTKTRTYFLHSKGYYQHIRDFKSKADIAFLNQFKHRNAFPLFGLRLYKKMAADNMKSLAKAQ